jgi:hypothetical protein
MKTYHTIGSFHTFVVRNEVIRCFNGYILIPKGHPLYGLHYDNILVRRIDVHGGFSYSQFDAQGNWIIGFDTAHSDDNDTIWTHDAVLTELKNAVKQL